jgi:hypothetical protein
MKNKTVYVEIEIKTDMDKLWEHTQTPELHQQWDLRFSEINYLPRNGEDEYQKFLYRTRIGFGLSIAGTGETKAEADRLAGQRISTLTFGSEQSISLIREGGGYWKYKPNREGVTFITQYDYRTRFGSVGQLFDRLLFRPLFGYATAWSFDMLRIWLEKQIPPAVSLQRAFVHYLSVIALAVLWFYQGLVPKLLYPQSGESMLLQQTGWFPGWETVILCAAGIFEMGFALFMCLLHRRKWVYQLQALLLMLLGIAAVSGTPELLQAPFNPLTLSLAMIVMGVFASATITDLPNAAKCLRKPIKTNKSVNSDSTQGGECHGIHLSASVGQ